LQKSFGVILAKAGIQVFRGFLDPGFRRGDGFVEFCRSLQIVLSWFRDDTRETVSTLLPFNVGQFRISGEERIVAGIASSKTTGGDGPALR
jgi:hypothetical protein